MGATDHAVRARHVDEDIRNMVDTVRAKTENKVGGMRKALQQMTRRTDGALTRDEVNVFLRNNGLAKNGEADRFFDGLDTDKKGHIDYDDFRACFGPAPVSRGSQRV